MSQPEIFVLFALLSKEGSYKQSMDVDGDSDQNLDLYSVHRIKESYHECGDGIEKIHSKDLSDQQIFLSIPHTNDGFFYLLTIQFLIFILK